MALLGELGELGEHDKLEKQLQCLAGFHGGRQPQIPGDLLAKAKASLCNFGLIVEAGRSRVILLDC